ncbi:NADH-quinone oxidoreductase subunit NuoN [Endothiovibrio diazotrophicus]
MHFVTPDFLPALPEMFVAGMLCFILVLDAFLNDAQRNATYLLAQATLFGAALLTLTGLGGEAQLTFNGSFIKDAMGDLLKVFLYVTTIGVFLYSRDYLRQRDVFKGEYFVLGLAAVLGMMVMISAHSFLTIYLGLEMLSLSLYAMVAFERSNGVASEAAMKYFVLGALASGMLLYGISMLYGATGSLDLKVVAEALPNLGRDPLLAFGLVFVVVGLAFKLGAVPFHMWLPDVYHGAPTSVTLFIGTAPKLAAFAMVMRVLADGLGGLVADWQQMLIILAVLSLAIGNVVAIAQTNLKRMFAYSTISHVGFLMLGILAGTPEGYSAAMFYTITYALTALGGFGMILLLSRKGFEAENLEDFKGLNRKSPWFAFMMLLIIFSMAGVPPTVGFYAKLAVLQSVIAIDLLWLAVVAVAFAIIGAFYYIRVVKIMYFDDPTDEEGISAPFDMKVLLSANGLAMVALGVLPGGLMALCSAAI